MIRCALTALLLSLIAPLGAQTPPGAIVTEAVVKAPPNEVWRAWTTKEGIESWMVRKTDIDLRVGGRWRTSYSAESNLDDERAIHHTVLALDPERMLAFRTIKAPQGFPFPEAIAETWTVVYLEPAGADGTKVSIRMLGYRDNAEMREMHAFFERGNRITLDSLVKRFGGA